MTQLEIVTEGSQLENDLPQVLQQFGEIDESMKQVIGIVEKLTQELGGGQISTDKGLSVLEVKNIMMLHYLTNLTYLIGLKCSGKSIKGDAAIERLIEIRTVLERVRPIDQKLKYQIEKMVKIALTGEMDENDPMRFRAHPENMLNKLEESDEESESDKEEDAGVKGKKEDRSGVYIPPKLAAVHYEDDDKQSTRKQKEQERARKRALNSSVIQELREEYLDTPVEIAHTSSLKAKISRRQQEKKEYEEAFFTRLPTSRKEKHKSRQMMTMGNLGDQMTHFEDIRALDGVHTTSGPKKRKLKGTKAKKSKSKRKKFH